MKPLKQGQLWKQEDKYYRIVVWERLGIRFKEMDAPDSEDGTVHDLSKKDFCRLIKGAELVQSDS